MRLITLVLAAVSLAAPLHILGQDLSPANAAITTGGADGREDDDDEGNPRLGLLGLLGLGGLFGLFRREPDIHIDARRNKPD